MLLPKWSGDLKYGPCPPARDFGSRVSRLVFDHLAMLDQKNSTQTWSTDWLRKQPIQWPMDDAFIAMKSIVDGLHGVNDAAERGCRTAVMFKV